MNDYIVEYNNSLFNRTDYIAVQAETSKEAAKKAFEIALRCNDVYRITISSVYKKTNYKAGKKGF